MGLPMRGLADSLTFARGRDKCDQLSNNSSPSAAMRWLLMDEIGGEEPDGKGKQVVTERPTITVPLLLKLQNHRKTFIPLAMIYFLFFYFKLLSLDMATEMDDIGNTLTLTLNERDVLSIQNANGELRTKENRFQKALSRIKVHDISANMMSDRLGRRFTTLEKISRFLMEELVDDEKFGREMDTVLVGPYDHRSSSSRAQLTDMNGGSGSKLGWKDETFLDSHTSTAKEVTFGQNYNRKNDMRMSEPRGATSIPLSWKGKKGSEGPLNILIYFSPIIQGGIDYGSSNFLPVNPGYGFNSRRKIFSANSRAGPDNKKVVDIDQGDKKTSARAVYQPRRHQ